MHILVTGGAGYIGSHAIVELIAHNHQVTVVDDLSNSSKEVIRRIEKITNTAIPFHVFDVADTTKLNALFASNSFDAVMHFAGLKAVGESVTEPLRYFRTNIDAALSVLEAMKNHSVHRLILSSSATVYGSAPVPYTESFPAGRDLASPYAKTKYMIEEIMQSAAAADPKNIFITLRYFNPIGAHPSGLIGEYPSGAPNNLMPYLAQVATGQRPELTIFGNDYPTKDGTGVRDYIHVVDLAKGHVAALTYTTPGMTAINLGTGHGTSVLELVHAFEKASGQKITYRIAPRRQGDLPEYYADATKAKELLHWQATKTITEACADTWRWQSHNPHGYQS
ncbi:MAG TPA: UDP-glucose 4-epimerase GalE [Candidatus Saccharimonadales bacterium]